VLRENGWDPQWIVRDPDEQGPYAVVRLNNARCGCCGGAVAGWTVLNLATATGTSVEWTHDEGEIDAQDHAGLLNAAWIEGHSYALRAAAQEAGG
jgi:hypothetical protein